MDQERTKRKLSGILSADVVGYSRLMQEDEQFTIKCLEDSKKLIGNLIEEYKGRVVDSPGDNILAEFSSVVNAVDCAVAIQDKLQSTNALLPERNRMTFRIGVNLGDVIDEDGKIYGDGVNIAARIEGLASPGAVCISRTAYDQVKSKLNFGYEYLGEHNLKNISEPLRVYRVLTGADSAGKVIGEKKFFGSTAGNKVIILLIILLLAAAGAIGWIIFSGSSEKVEPTSLDRMAFSLPDITSIAVLPFQNLSDDKNLDYFSDGLTEEIATGLSKHPDLVVTQRNPSSETGKDQHERQISEVRYILRGSVRQGDGNRVRINVSLIESAGGFNIWTESYDREINNNILAIQSDIMWHVFREIRIRLIDGNQKPDIFPDNPPGIEYTETYYLLYRYYEARPFEPGRLERLNEAVELADKLIKMKPDPWVYFMKASIFIALSRFPDNRSKTYLEDAEKAALKAENLNKGAYFGIYGEIYISRFERAGDVNDLETALDYYTDWIKFAPDSFNAHFGTGFTLLLQKKYDEAVRQYEIGLTINPTPESQNFVFLGIACSSPSAEGFSNLNKAKGFLERALRPNQGNFLAYLYLTLIYSYEDQMDKAHSYAEKILRTSPSFSLQTYRTLRRRDKTADETITRFHEKLLKKAGIPEESRVFDFR